METCALCGKGGEGFSLLGTTHKELGWIMVCRDCWRNLWDNNSMVAGSSCSGKCSVCSR